MLPDELRVLTHALRRPDTELAAIAALKGVAARPAVEGLVERIHLSSRARAVIAAMDALVNVNDPLVDEALTAALMSPHASVRNLAAQAITTRSSSTAQSELAELLRADPSWLVRRSTLGAIKEWRNVLLAADDPHWRVRHALIRRLLAVGDTEVIRSEILKELSHFRDDRPVGVRLYLEWRWTGTPPTSFPTPESPSDRCPFWDWDVAVLARTIERMTEEERIESLGSMPFLVAHSDERVRNAAAEVLRNLGEAPQLDATLALFREPRLGIRDTLEKLFSAIDQDRLDELSAEVPTVPDRTPSRSASHPLQRATDLTEEAAAELMANPGSESSWHVLARAAKLTQTPFWKVEPTETWRPPPTIPPPHEVIALSEQQRSQPRHLGRHRWPVSPLGISGHYNLPVEGFSRAFEAGVNLMFWEPNYASLSEFFNRLSPSDRTQIRLVAGTFEADGERVRRDAERVLRMLKIDRIDLFLLFWVQEWNRITPDVRETLEALKRSGKIAEYGLSTHNRRFAVEALDSGWNPIMVRHSAAHRGAEEQIFPKAVDLDVGLLAFNVTCYGRLLLPHGDTTPPSPADCLRYTMSRPGVTACWSAPATLEQLDENLSALHDPELPDDQLRNLLRHGDNVYREDSIFRRTVRAL